MCFFEGHEQVVRAGHDHEEDHDEDASEESLIGNDPRIPLEVGGWHFLYS
jgi:hypothetical protein